MELKDMVLSTLAEMEDNEEVKDTLSKAISTEETNTENNTKNRQISTAEEEAESVSGVNSELAFLNSVRERLLVLFEGFQAPNNKNIEAKVDITLNFLEYVLATIDSRVEVLKKEVK